MHSLSWKFGGALLLIVVISVGLMFYLTSLSTTREFSQYVEHGNRMYLQMAKSSLTQFYSQQGSWSAVQQVLGSLRRTDGDRLVVADSSGRVVGDTAQEWLEKEVKEIGLKNGTPITVSGSEIGKLYLVSSGVSFGPGRMIGMNQMTEMTGGSTNLPSTATAEQNFLSRINTSLWITGIIAVAVALMLGLLLTRQITRPVRALTKGARHIAKGDLGYRVEIASKDEIGELARSFNSMAANLDKGEKTRQRLIADIAHELRTPLTVIEGTVDAILDGVFEPDREHLASVKEQTALLTRLIGDLRDLSLAESGQLKLNLAPTNMTELVQRKLFQAEVKAREKNIELEMNVATSIPEVNIDSARMEQVIVNLIDNAIRHTPAKGKVAISVAAVAGMDGLMGGKPGLMVSVADTGEGIPEEYLPTVFERFYRVETSRARSSGGVGLGLAIVKQMVEAHGGKVWVESEPGRGSTFYVVLPVATA